MRKLLPCPFCGAKQGDEGPTIWERGRQDRRILDKAGRPRKRVNITHRVECTNCGAAGADSIEWMSMQDAETLTDDMIERSKAAAAFAWNARQPISDRAYDLVSRLIVDAIAKLDGS